MVREVDEPVVLIELGIERSESFVDVAIGVEEWPAGVVLTAAVALVLAALTWSGTTQYRLNPGESGFINLILAGDWTRTGTNTACVESATMSGKAASRAICGSPAVIPYENFMQGPKAP